jgi:acetyltransferase-like isoleucine patch superfamily enzyme
MHLHTIEKETTAQSDRRGKPPTGATGLRYTNDSRRIVGNISIRPRKEAFGPMNHPLRFVIHHVGNFLRWGKAFYYRANGIRIGRRTMISLGAKLDVRRGRIIIGDDCLITYGSMIASHDGASRMVRREDNGEGTVVIGNNVFVGIGSIILRDVTIGDNSVIGAGSIVTKDVPPGVLVCGNPARVVKELCGPFPILSSKDHLKRKRPIKDVPLEGAPEKGAPVTLK